jgi:hypothetical protein
MKEEMKTTDLNFKIKKVWFSLILLKNLSLLLIFLSCLGTKTDQTTWLFWTQTKNFLREKQCAAEDVKIFKTMNPVM